ncbi:unannotated protein [freshwater metagenome]|uniref:Unannotated protein n=1 Tax=freshwater metagenome TaxID=449393 RepID=A0A6J7CZR4_9ZZZZ
MSIHAIAPDDIVRTHADGACNAREPLVVLEPLIAFLDEHGIGAGEPSLAPLGEGHSNVTYLVERGGTEFVLRRPPRGPLPPSAHDVLREARVLRALEGRARVPRILAVCEDSAPIGAPFCVMEKIDGHVITDRVPQVLGTPQDQRRLGEELVDALVELHAVDWRAAGLEDFGKPTGYCERQVRRFRGLWDINRTREIAEIDAVAQWLGANLPQSPAATIVHGDFRLGNMVYAPEPPARLAAILDWEMATIGDPLADLGYLATLWSDRDDPTGGPLAITAVTRQPGFLRRDELIARYEERSGRSMTDIRWYQTLAVWKFAIFMEGNYKRAVTGASDDPFNLQFGEGVLQLAAHARELALGGT